MMRSIYLLLAISIACSASLTTIIHRGNIIQQLMFLMGMPLHEEYYRLAMNVLIVNSLYHESTNCTHDTYCVRTGYCSSICKTGTVSVSKWLSFATRTQSTLSTLGSFCEHQSIGTHNSAMAAPYGFGVEDSFYSMLLSSSYLQFNQVRTLSQYYSITDQLNLGVRHLEIDIHYFHGQLRISHCGFSVGIINYIFHFMEKTLKWFNFLYDTETIGCLPSFNGIPSEDQLLITHLLDEITIWMNESRNRDEFIILYLDTSSNLIRWNQVDSLLSILRTVFGSLIISPTENMNLLQLVSENRRLMIVSRRVFPNAEDIFFYTNTTHTCQYPIDMGKLCDNIGSIRIDKEPLAGKTQLPIFYSRAVTNQLRYGPLSKDFVPIPSPVNIYKENTQDLYKLGVNTLAADYIDEEQAKDHIWTWKLDLNIDKVFPQIDNLCIAVESHTHYWILVPCKETHPVLCRNSMNATDFIIGGYTSNPQLGISFLHDITHADYSRVQTVYNLCPFGYIFYPPISAYYQRIANTILDSLSNGTTIWIGLRLEKYYFRYHCLFAYTK